MNAAPSAPADADRSAKVWLVRTDDHVVGPVSLDQIERALLRDKIPAGCDLAHVDREGWWPLVWTFPFTSEEARARATLTEAPARPVPAPRRKKISSLPPGVPLPKAKPPPRRRRSGVQPVAVVAAPVPPPAPLPAFPAPAATFTPAVHGAVAGPSYLPVTIIPTRRA